MSLGLVFGTDIDPEPSLLPRDSSVAPIDGRGTGDQFTFPSFSVAPDT